MRRQRDFFRNFLILFFISLKSKQIQGQYLYTQEEPKSENILSVSVQKFADICRPLKESYLKLEPKRKFATGAVIGYTTSRVVIRTATQALKWCGAAYIISEALHASGIMNDLDFVSNENHAKIQKIKMDILKEADKMRVTLREKYLNLEVMRNLLDNAVQRDVSGSTGFATGAAIGLVF